MYVNELLLSFVVGIDLVVSFTWSLHCMSYLYPSVNIKYTIYCHMKYYSRVPFSSYILFTRDYCYVSKSSSTKGGSTSGVVLSSLLRCFSSNGPAFFLRVLQHVFSYCSKSVCYFLPSNLKYLELVSKTLQEGWYPAVVVARVSDHLSQSTCLEMLHQKTDEHLNPSVEVRHLVGKLSTAETLLRCNVQFQHVQVVFL